MDIVCNKKLSTNKGRTTFKQNQNKKFKRRSELKKPKMDGIGGGIPKSSIRRNQQLHLLHKAKDSFSGARNDLLQEIKNKNCTKKKRTVVRQKVIRDNFNDSFNLKNKSLSNYDLREIGFSNFKDGQIFINRECVVDKNDNFESEELKFFSSVKLWNFSLVGAMILGMLVMGFIHQSLGGDVLAKIKDGEKQGEEKVEEDNLYFSQEENFYSRGQATDGQKKELEIKIRDMVVGQPIENMIPYILEQDYYVAAYLIAIAKKESQWGSRVPILNGKDCYNYWGYRGNRDLMGSAGHTCFNSRKDAVETVGKRLDNLIYEQNKKTASDLIVWKCGSTCEDHSQAGVDSWIDVVDMYYSKLVK